MIRRQGTGFRVHTDQGTVQASKVLIATNGYTGKDFPELRRRIIPVPSFIIVTEDLGTDRVRKLIPRSRMIVETRERHCYFRPSPDGSRIVFGGRAALLAKVSTEFATRELKKLMVQVFPELKAVKLTHSWRGFVCFTFDETPHVGQIDGVWHAMGYCGNGNTMAPYLGHKAALLMTGDPDGETAYAETPFPTRVWHRGYPWFMPAAEVIFRLRDYKTNLQRSRSSRKRA